ncbi:hypothetical protein AO961_32510 [Pseudomonas aeruginosa]|nr:hypothetical protein AO961_32510 [Pseudomonas aeruginosa]
MQEVLMMRCMKKYIWLVCFFGGILPLGGCQAAPEMLSAPVMGYNHTSSSINWFTVNGAGGSNIGPNQGGGSQVCCSAVPRHWNSELRAVVEWEVDPEPYSSADWSEPTFSDEWRTRMKAQRKTYTRHKSVVEIPRYDNPGPLRVHFLPCNQVRVAAAATSPGYLGYPYNYPMRDMPCKS